MGELQSEVADLDHEGLVRSGVSGQRTADVDRRVCGRLLDRANHLRVLPRARSAAWISLGGNDYGHAAVIAADDEPFKLEVPFVFGDILDLDGGGGEDAGGKSSFYLDQFAISQSGPVVIRLLTPTSLL